VFPDLPPFIHATPSVDRGDSQVPYANKRY
jgi:hypothetical protein